MEKENAKMLIQLFAEEESETTDLEEDEVIEAEYDDTAEEETSDPVEEETTEEPEKGKSLKELLKEHPEYQDEMNDIMESRVNRERKKLDRDYQKKLSKYEELAYLTKAGLKAESDDDALEKTRDFYGKQGIRYTPNRSAREEEILASADVEEILENADSIEEIESEVQRLNAKSNISNREKLIAQKLTEEIDNRRRISELSKIGVKKEVYNSSEFKAFEKQFTKDTPIANIYELYKIKTTKKKVDNPGSLKGVQTKSKKEYITEAEYDRMTDKEIEENMDLIRRSMEKW